MDHASIVLKVLPYSHEMIPPHLAHSKSTGESKWMLPVLDVAGAFAPVQTHPYKFESFVNRERLAGMDRPMFSPAGREERAVTRVVIQERFVHPVGIVTTGVDAVAAVAALLKVCLGVMMVVVIVAGLLRTRISNAAFEVDDCLFHPESSDGRDEVILLLFHLLSDSSCPTWPNEHETTQSRYRYVSCFVDMRQSNDWHVATSAWSSSLSFDYFESSESRCG